MVNRYLPANQYELNLSTVKADTWGEEQIANLFNEKIGYPVVEGAKEYGSTPLVIIKVIIKNTWGMRFGKLIKIARKVARGTMKEWRLLK
ncbi:MAG: hypothetical protein QW348_07605 [Ignisphaera sp.]